MRYVRFDSFDAGYYNGWDMKSAMHPHKLGYKLTKYLTTITFTAERPGGYWEDRGLSLVRGSLTLTPPPPRKKPRQP